MNLNYSSFFGTRENKSLSAFVILAIGCLGTLLSVLIRRYILYSGYNDPPPILIYTLIFDYLAFSLIAFIFPWSWKSTKDHRIKRILSVVLTGLLFVIVYSFISSFIEWWESEISYSLWNGFSFTPVTFRAFHFHDLSDHFICSFSIWSNKEGRQKTELPDPDTGKDKE